MTFAETVAVLEDIRDVDDERELERLEGAISALSSTGEVPRAVSALLRVFERFPGGDGHGIFWTIVHLVETAGGSYEDALLASVRRTPSLFGVTMILRRSASTEEPTLRAALLEVVQNENAPTDARALARDYLEDQDSKMPPG